MPELSPPSIAPVPSPAINPENIPAIIPIKFWTKYKYLSPAEDGGKEEVALAAEEDWVEWVKKGETSGPTTREAIKRLAPNLKKNRRAAPEWVIVGPAYEAWKRGSDAPITGTPLFAWSGVTPELAGELKKLNILSIEDLAALPDHSIAKLPIADLRKWRQRAKAYIEAANSSEIGDKLAKRDARIEAQDSTIAEMREAMKAMETQLAAMNGQMAAAASTLTAPSPDDEFVEVGANDVPASAPRGRGRPRKQD